MDESKLWTKDFLIVSAINFFITSIFYLLIVVIGVYAVDVYNASTSEAGLVTGIFIIGTLVGRFFIGRSIESIGRKKTLYIGTILFALFGLLYFLHINVLFLLLVRFLHGVALGIASTATGTIVAQIIPARRKGEGIGYFSLSSTLAVALGPFLGILLSQHTSYEVIFGLCVVLGMISFITSIFLHVPRVEEVKTEGKMGWKLSSFIEPRAVPIALVVLIIGLCYSGVLSFINFYAVEVDLVETASFFFLVYSIVILLSRPFTGRLMDMKGANFVMYPAFIVFSIGMFLLSIADNSFTLLLSGALIGLGFGNMQSCTQAIAVKVTPVHRMGLATSTFYIFLDAGLGFGPYLLGFIIVYTDYSTLYSILSVVILLTILLYFVLHGRKDKESIDRMAQ